MTYAAEARVERLLADAAGSLNRANLWLAATCIPADEALASCDSGSLPRIQAWLRQEARNWPAPLKVGDHLCKPSRDDRLVFTPSPNGHRGPAHHVELHPEGSSLVAVQVGSLIEPGTGQGAIWAIGEGSVAWLTVCFVRLAAEWAAQAGARGSAFIDLRLLSSALPEDQPRLQLWNFANGTNAPCSDVRPMIQPTFRSFDLAAARTGEVAQIARSLLLPLLAQFGLDESRHIDAKGTMISANFVGHAPQIAVWARTIGASCRAREA